MKKFQLSISDLPAGGASLLSAELFYDTHQRLNSNK